MELMQYSNLEFKPDRRRTCGIVIIGKGNGRWKTIVPHCLLADVAAALNWPESIDAEFQNATVWSCSSISSVPTISNGEPVLVP
mmetsp:Transcript_18612/g.46086  ORF Transcript_18612/g.46086 Transcript_18612/m.46086 type:complete len:84 (+) Transcript_18612:492-743(+)